MHVSLDSALGRQRRLNSVGESVLQIAPEAAAAYSLRSLTGGDPKVVRVRRDTGGGAGDNDEQDFTASEVSSGALVDFVGSGNDGFVETWYDQSGDSQNVVQATAGSQPKIVSSGSLIAGGLRFDDAQKLETASTFSFASGTTLSTFITNSSDADETSYVFRFLSNYILLNTGSGLRRVTAGTFANAGTASGNEELWSTISTINSSGGTSNFFVNGTLASDPNADIGTKVVSPARNLNIGGLGSDNHWNGTVNEVIFYPTDQTSNRAALDANIISHYGIS